jgi:hypothetical protein
MPEFETTFRFAHPAEAVWQFVSWSGVERLAGSGAFTGASFKDRDPVPGAVRYTHLADGSRIEEQLALHAAHRFYYEYVVPDAPTLPIRGYHGIVEVTPVSARECTLRLAHDCEPFGVSPDEWREAWLKMETAVADFIGRELAAEAPPHVELLRGT